MPSLFSSPPKPPKPPAFRPPQDSSLNAQLQALSRRSGENAAVLTRPSTMMTRTLTGS